MSLSVRLMMQLNVWLLFYCCLLIGKVPVRIVNIDRLRMFGF